MTKNKLFKKGFLIFLMGFIFVINTKRAEASELVDINSASSVELQRIVGVGPVISQRIIEERPYNTLDDLIKVKGIGDITLSKIKQQGIAYIFREEENNTRYTVYYFLAINVGNPDDNEFFAPSRELNGGEYIFNTKDEAMQWILDYQCKQSDEGYAAYYVGVCEQGQDPHALQFYT